MQYTIQLSNDYDDNLIRKRVEERSKMFDDLEGMAHKSYLYNSKDKLYAPFYIWHNNASAKQFLLDDLFRGVVETFNRPRVRTWIVIHAKYGNIDIKPTFAAIESDVIEPESYIPEILEEEERNEAELFKSPDLFYYVIAIDTDRWEIIRYTLWKDEKSAKLRGADCVQMYDVLNVSEPCGYEK